jgi:hypothetical protein
MAWYRLYFLGAPGDIRNVDEFYTDDEGVALIIADRLHDAVRDLYAGWELWQGSRRVFRCTDSEAPRPHLSQAAITMKMQADFCGARRYCKRAEQRSLAVRDRSNA